MTVGYHNLNNLATLETTTAPSCTKDATDVVGNSFISLSTPLASSSRLSQINDLLQHNRNTTTALVAVSQTMDCSNIDDTAAVCTTVAASNNNNIIANQVNGVETSPFSSSTSINTPPIEDAHKSCANYADLSAPPPLKPAPIVAVTPQQNCIPEKLPAPPPLQPSLSMLTSEMSLSSTTTVKTTTATPATKTTTETMIDLATMPSTASNSDVLLQDSQTETEIADKASIETEAEMRSHENMDTTDTITTMTPTTTVAEIARPTAIETEAKITADTETGTTTENVANAAVSSSPVNTTSSSDVSAVIEVAVAVGN